ncbi:ribonuclease D [Congregibacter brevis]|uniref:Ribonuclease D n=1 Tax=Congregibacter brevis TaxID=3081201 RepID=A0ABZ0I864_9GAMM|nr:ribonuclease D [Congregibacter sp. IMCC45268]
MNWTLIESDEALTSVLSSLSDVAEIAVDTEFMRRNSYYPHVALLQLCSDDHAWLIDPLQITELGGLRELMTNPNCVKVLHSCSEDLEVFRHWLGVVPSPLVDTQRATALLGKGFGLGYRALVEQLLGVELEKGETRSDWLQRPLSESQCHYAALDVLELVPAWAILKEEAQKQGRMEWILDEGAEATRLLLEREGLVYRRVKSASRLSRRQLEALRRLCIWREDLARTVDKPRGWIVEDKAFIAIAQAMPEDFDALAGLDVLPASVLRKQGSALTACVHKALAAPEEELPEPLPAPLAPPQRNLLKALRGVAKSIAAELAVAPEILISTADLELLLREASGAAIAEPERWQGWRATAVIAPLRDSLPGAA